uniref:Uncharacterized protein n=1 Tax=Rhizophora mucronata TaxID=61149 RepID=A0A2P2N0Q2_RHIMU
MRHFSCHSYHCCIRLCKVTNQKHSRPYILDIFPVTVPRMPLISCYATDLGTFSKSGITPIYVFILCSFFSCNH